MELSRTMLVVFVTCFLLTKLPQAQSLRCYQCYSNNLEPCPYEDLKECPRFQFYNRCNVKVRKLITGEMFVRRDCGVGPCHGYDGEYGQEVQLRENCDTYAPEYECTACCRGDGCNYSSATSLPPAIVLMTSLFFLGLKVKLIS